MITERMKIILNTVVLHTIVENIFVLIIMITVSTFILSYCHDYQQHDCVFYVMSSPLCLAQVS